MGATFFKGNNTKLLPTSGIEFSDGTIAASSDLAQNYIQFPTAVVEPTSNGWRTYADAAGTAPVDGTGGSPNTTLARNTSSPLNSTGDFRMVKSSGASRQGEGFSTDFTISNKHLARVLQVTFDMELISGTYTSTPVRVYIIQDPTGTPVVIEPVNVALQLGVAGIKCKHIASFQTDIAETDYRLCIHIAGTDTDAYTIDFNNFRVWEPIANYGAIITDWVSYTPTFGGFGTVTNINFKWRRVGSSIEVEGLFRSGSTSGDSATFTIPYAPLIETTASQTIRQIGLAFRDNSTVTGTMNLLAYNNDNIIRFGFLRSDSAVNVFDLRTGNDFSIDSDVFISLSVPIAGWGSNMALSSDAGDGREVCAIANGSPTGGGASGAIIIFPSIEKDTHGAYNTTSGRFTAPVTGFYEVSYGLLATNGNVNIRLYKNAVASYYMGYTVSAIANAVGSCKTYCNAGDILDIRPDGNLGTMSGSFVSFDCISTGSQLIGTNETVACSYYSAATQTSLTTQINFGTKIYDTHGAVTTGASWKFTAPMAGKYNVKAFLIMSGGGIGVSLFKGGSVSVYSVTYMDSASGCGNASLDVDLLAEEYIDLRPISSASVVGGVLSSGYVSHIQISRIGI